MLSRRQQFRGKFSRRVTSRRNIRRTKEDIRRNSEVKFNVKAYRFRTWLRIPWFWSANPFPISAFRNYDVSMMDYYSPVFENQTRFSSYSTNGGLIGEIIKPKMLTVNLHLTAHLLGSNHQDQDITRQPPWVTIANDNLLSRFMSMYQDCILRVALIRPRSGPPKPQPPVDNKRLGIEDLQWFLLPTKDQPADNNLTEGNPDYLYGMLPFDPARALVISDQTYPIRLSNSPVANSTLPLSIKMTYHFKDDETFKLKPGSNFKWTVPDYNSGFLLYVTITPLNGETSVLSDPLRIEVSSSRIWKLSYYDI